MFWWVTIAVLVAPIVVRLATGKWGNAKPGQSFLDAIQENWQRIRNTPYARERQRQANRSARATLLFGLPLGLILAWLCEWMSFSREIYVPIVACTALSASTLPAVYLDERNAPPDQS
jgi:hypothetical protein